VPVIKVATNSELFARMHKNLDINAGTIIDGEETIEEVGRRIFEAIVAVASGQLTKAEYRGHREFSIGRIAPTFCPLLPHALSPGSSIYGYPASSLPSPEIRYL